MTHSVGEQTVEHEEGSRRMRVQQVAPSFHQQRWRTGKAHRRSKPEPVVHSVVRVATRARLEGHSIPNLRSTRERSRVVPINLLSRVEKRIDCFFESILFCRAFGEDGGSPGAH
jgi:hypothetical protein